MRLPTWLMTRSIGTRLHWATATAVVAIAVLLASLASIENARIQDARVALLRSIVDSAIGIAVAYQREEQTGHLSKAEAQRAAFKAIGAIRYLGNEYVWINDLHPTMVMHPIKPELDGQDLSDYKDPAGKRLFVAMADTVRAQGAGVVDYLWPRQGADAPVPKLSYVQGFQPWGWVVGTGVYVDDLVAARRRMALILTGFGVSASLIVGVVIWLLGRSVVRPTRAIAAVTEHLSRGELAVQVIGIDRRDELGAVARALDVLKENSLGRVRLERAADDERAAKDRRQAAMDHLTKDFGEIISGVLTRLTDAAEKMSATAREMTADTDRTRTSAAQTADGSTASSRDLATVASATVELTASVDEIVRQVAHASDATRDAVGRADETNATFRNLTTMANRIGDVGGAISKIAAQTNLLALNATIEASRAGEAGRGFAVVANEVKLLAAQTARATAEISTNANAMKEATEQTAVAIREVGAAIGKVDVVSAAIAAAIEQQGATTREIASSVQAVSVTSERTATAMAEVAAIADATGGMSQTVLAASDDIGQVAATLRDDVDHFLKTMAQEDDHRRHYERVPGNDTPATLIVPGDRQLPVAILNISRGGAALRSSFEAQVGVAVKVTLPDSRKRVDARVVRHSDGTVSIAFRQDPASLAEVDAAIASLTHGHPAARAA